VAWWPSDFRNMYARARARGHPTSRKTWSLAQSAARVSAHSSPRNSLSSLARDARCDGVQVRWRNRTVFGAQYCASGDVGCCEGSILDISCQPSVNSACGFSSRNCLKAPPRAVYVALNLTRFRTPRNIHIEKVTECACASEHRRSTCAAPVCKPLLICAKSCVLCSRTL